MITAVTYDKYPYVAVNQDARPCSVGWREIGGRLRQRLTGPAPVVCVECYPGCNIGEIEEALTQQLHPSCVIRSAEALLPARKLDDLVSGVLTDDPVFGQMNELSIEDLFDSVRLAGLTRLVARPNPGMTLVIGTGAWLISGHADVLVYADLARWEIQQRQRRNQISNLGADNYLDRPAQKYKRAFFVDWRAADRLKRQLLDRLDFLLDTNIARQPKMISGGDFRRGLELTVCRPFRVVPFFDPGPWGGDWMMERFELPPDKPNYAWGFDCVPEENSLFLGFGTQRVEIPAIDVVFHRPAELLGARVLDRFGAEFPIRFDFLDTMNGGNLSLQVHPLTSYIREHFGMTYTQDESYYILDAAHDACVYLGLKEGIDREEMIGALRQAGKGKRSFPAEQYVNRWPARKHDHFLIPGGTIHCSGRNSVVLEISATPYIFTFKLWDWDRVGLDGRPRPIHLEHGIANIQWDRTTGWVGRNLVNPVTPVGRGKFWREERTGLHSLEFIETRRHWFTGPTQHDTNGSVNVLNLVEGNSAIVESPAGAFEPFTVHYAETFIVPAAVGAYRVRPGEAGTPGAECGTMKASIRDDHEHGSAGY